MPTEDEIKQIVRESLGASKAAMDSGDSSALARFVRLSKMQVALNGSVSAALSLEMIGRLRRLEKALIEIADNPNMWHRERMQIAASAIQQ